MPGAQWTNLRLQKHLPPFESTSRTAPSPLQDSTKRYGHTSKGRSLNSPMDSAMLGVQEGEQMR